MSIAISAIVKAGSPGTALPHEFLGGPTNGSIGASATFRTLVAGDLPINATFGLLTVGTLVVNNGTVNNGTTLGDTLLSGTLSCINNGTISGTCLPPAAVLDNLATPTYPTSPQTQGVWYGPGAKAGSGTSTSIAIGVSPIAASTDTISIGHNTFATGVYSIAIGTNATAITTLSFISIAIGPFANASSLSATAIGGLS
ncbi:MAG TPA: hypothetical protein VNZ45_06430, partial [Bacteroidia bacterium]|nr:hypothetical protein [Bacteroidia bacterium]